MRPTEKQTTVTIEFDPEMRMRVYLIAETAEDEQILRENVKKLFRKKHHSRILSVSKNKTDLAREMSVKSLVSED